ncbi:MAG: hypothetical protein HY549_07500, partial [Elusimicrobia bacterium]|nr:hypothetical protein [Elusimicrobiota bacterium]
MPETIPMPAAVRVRRDNDPFKKYWHLVLLSFALVGGWICLPLLDGSGSGVALREQGLMPADSGLQSLDSIHNPSGAPGSAMDLSMEGAGAYKKKEDPSVSRLYQASAEEPGKAAAPEPAESKPANLAEALKAISLRSPSFADNKPFSPPKANFGSLSGLGSGSSGSSGQMSASGGFSSGLSGLGSFSTAKPDIGFAKAQGLGSEEQSLAKGGSPGMQALNAAKATGLMANQQASYDAAARMGGAGFDGRGAGANSISGGGIAIGGSYDALDRSPKDLKVNDPNLSMKEIQPPPTPEPKIDEEEQRRQMMMQMIMMMVVGGVVN